MIGLDEELLAEIRTSKDLMRIHKHEEALEIIKGAEVRFGISEITIFAKVSIFIALSRDEEALNILDSLLTEVPNNIRALKTRGRILLKLKRNREALHCFEVILEAEPDNIGILISEGVALLALSRFDQAGECFVTVLKIDPNNRKAKELYDEYSYGKSRALRLAKKPHEALEVIEKTVELIGETQNTLCARMHLSQAMNDDNQSIEYFYKIIQDPELSNSSRGQILKYVLRQVKKLLSVNKYEEAIDLLRKAECYVDDAEQIHFSRGLILQAQGKHEEACVYFKQAHSLKPQNIGTLLANARSYIALGRYEEARSHCLEVLKIKPKEFTPLILIAKSYEEEGNYREAHKWLDKSILQNPKEVYPYITKGEIYAKQGDDELANEYFNRALEVNPNSLTPLLSKGKIFLETGKIDDAKSCFEKILQKSPNHAEASELLSICNQVVK